MANSLASAECSPVLRHKHQNPLAQGVQYVSGLRHNSREIENAATEPVHVRVGYAGLAAFQLPLWVLKEQGFDKKYGLDVQIVLVRGGAMSMQALGGTRFFLQQILESLSHGILGKLGAELHFLWDLIRRKLPLTVLAYFFGSDFRARLLDNERLDLLA